MYHTNNQKPQTGAQLKYHANNQEPQTGAQLMYHAKDMKRYRKNENIQLQCFYIISDFMLKKPPPLSLIQQYR